MKQFRLSWNQGQVAVIYPKARTPEEALEMAVRGCPTSLVPGMVVSVQTIYPDGKAPKRAGAILELVAPQLSPTLP